jgi:hypothetical protein
MRSFIGENISCMRREDANGVLLEVTSSVGTTATTLLTMYGPTRAISLKITVSYPYFIVCELSLFSKTPDHHSGSDGAPCQLAWNKKHRSELDSIRHLSALY